MSVMRLVPALAFCGLVGLQMLLSFTTVYAACCACGMSCPQGTAPRYSCTCCTCAIQDTSEKDVSYNTIFNDRPLEIFSAREHQTIIDSESGFNYEPLKARLGSVGSATRLDTIPAADLKFQCEHLNRLSEMLSQYQGRY
jgi:hypothetical protein